MAALPKCSCGKVHRSRFPWMQARLAALIRLRGPLVEVHSPAGAWWVPRVWVAFHGLAEVDLPMLALRYGWERISWSPTPGAGPQE